MPWPPIAWNMTWPVRRRLLSGKQITQDEIKKEYVLRNARDTDIPSVMLVNMKMLPENYWYGFYLSLLNEWGDLFFVIEHRGEIVGYSMSRIEHTIDPVLAGLHNELKQGHLSVYTKIKRFFDKPFRVAHLISIAVLREHWGRGLGSMLLKATIDVAKKKYEADAIYLEVRVTNERAIKLYEKFGFEKVKIIKEYYRDGEDAFVMVKRLKPLTESENISRKQKYIIII